MAIVPVDQLPPPPPPPPPLMPVTLQALVHLVTRQVVAHGLFPQGTPDATLEVVTLIEGLRATLEQPGSKVLNGDGSITVTPPPPRPRIKSTIFPVPPAEVTTANAAATVLGTWPLPDNTIFDIAIYVYGVDRGTGDVRRFRREATIRRRLSGAPAVIGAVETPSVDKGDAATASWTMVPSFSGNNLVINVTGQVGKTVDWSLFADVRQFAP